MIYLFPSFLRLNTAAKRILSKLKSRHGLFAVFKQSGTLLPQGLSPDRCVITASSFSISAEMSFFKETCLNHFMKNYSLFSTISLFSIFCCCFFFYTNHLPLLICDKLLSCLYCFVFLPPIEYNLHKDWYFSFPIFFPFWRGRKGGGSLLFITMSQLNTWHRVGVKYIFTEQQNLCAQYVPGNVLCYLI